VKNLYNLLSIGDLYLAMNEMKKAKEFLDKAYKIAKDIDSKREDSPISASVEEDSLFIHLKKTGETPATLKSGDCLIVIQNSETHLNHRTPPLPTT
ncbi:MAG: hypothetical protein KAW09_00065, partial [Thermoplasmata archaeon]|nr:hypothetical protein [Thermoplasmata archaeon]